jgi:hypothetical protein
MSAVSLGNHSAIVLPRAEQDRIRRSYRDVLGLSAERAHERGAAGSAPAGQPRPGPPRPSSPATNAGHNGW